MKIAVLEGGYSHEKEISLKSAETVYTNLDKTKYEPIKVRIDEDGWYVRDEVYGIQEVNKSDFSFQFDSKTIKLEYAFIVIHGTPGEDGKLQAYFDMLSIPYNTCSQLLSTLTFNKFYCNKVLGQMGWHVARSVAKKRDESFDENEVAAFVGLPCFVKPADGGSSFGVTKVTEATQLKSAVELATREGNGTVALIENFLEGREVTNGVYRSKEGVQVLPITEIISENDFFDFDAKYNGESNEVTPAKLDADLEERVKSYTENIYDILGMEGMARMDYILCGDIPYLIEINTVPGQSSASIVPKMVKADNRVLFQVYSEIIEYSLS